MDSRLTTFKYLNMQGSLIGKMEGIFLQLNK